MQTGQWRAATTLNDSAAYVYAALIAMGSVALAFYVPILHGIPFACSFLAIATVSYFWRTGPALLTAGICLVAVNYLIMGRAFYFELDARSVAQTAILGFTATILIHLVRQRDIARKAEQRSEASLESTLRSIADGVIITDTQAKVTFLNPAAETITGWSAQESIGTPLHDVLVMLNETTRKPVENPVDRVLETGSIVGLANHTVLVRRDGTEIPIDDSAAPTRDVTGEVNGAVIVFRDVDERRRLERERDALLLRAQRTAESLRLSAQGASLAAWDYDIRSERANWTEGSYLVWGVPFEEVETLEAMFRLIQPMYHQAIRDAIALSMETGTSYTVEFALVAEEGVEPRWCEARGVPEFDAEGGVIGLRGITMDITHRKRAERALLRTEKLAAAGRLAASVAHEINNPLEAAINLVYIARMAGSEADLVSSLAQAEQQLLRVSHIARQSLAFYRDSLLPALYRPAEALREVIAILQVRSSAKSIQIHFDLDDTLEVFGWAGDLRQIASNLVANALDAAGAMVSEDIRSLTESRQVIVRLRALQSKQSSARAGLVLTVADTGTGIPQQLLGEIFEAFFTTKLATGTGLGLWVSRTLAERSGGSIRVRSSTATTRHGTVFRVQLPSRPEMNATRVQEDQRFKNA